MPFRSEFDRQETNSVLRWIVESDRSDLGKRVGYGGENGVEIGKQKWFLSTFDETPGK